jgi:hypothetical protein
MKKCQLIIYALIFLSVEIYAAIPNVATLSEDNDCSSLGTAFDTNYGSGTTTQY